MATSKLIKIAGALLIALTLAGLLATALFIAGEAETDASRLSRWSPWLFAASLLAVCLLAAGVAAQIWILIKQRRKKAPGAQLAVRWTLGLVLIALPPVLILYGFSLKFLHSAVDNRFNVRISDALHEALILSREYIASEKTRAQRATRTQALKLKDAGEPAWQDILETELDASGALMMGVFNDSGNILAFASNDTRFLLPTPPDGQALLRLREGDSETVSLPIDDELFVQVTQRLGPNGVMQAIFPLPTLTQRLALEIESSWHAYQRLDYLRGYLKLSFTLLLTAVLLISALLAISAALSLAGRQVTPIARLAYAAGQIATGQYPTVPAASAHGELGALTGAFNRMSTELALAHRQMRESREQTENHRHYLETILQRLSSGVIGYGADGILRMANAAASHILALPLDEYVERPLSAIAEGRPAYRPLLEKLRVKIAEGVREWRDELQIQDGEKTRMLALRCVELPTTNDLSPSFVLLFDDQTKINQIPREAAWAEVAKRLAHEIKNPLTPIQLAAERIQTKLAGKLAPLDAEMLAKSTRTIVAQVDALKTMVSAFGDYARNAQLKLEPLNVNQLVTEVLDLYGHESNLRVETDFDPALPLLRADKGRIRQLLGNLIKNGIEACAPDKKIIVVSTKLRNDGAEKRLEVSIVDHGQGLPPGFGELWFEPYQTSKSKGTGLGLAVVKKIAEEHGATIAWHNRPGGGACFTVSFPWHL